jgi:hypothetical protein
MTELWLICGMWIVMCLLIAQALDERRQRWKLEQKVAAMEQRFHDGGIDLADSLATDVKITEKWREWDVDEVPGTRISDRESWRE